MRAIWAAISCALVAIAGCSSSESTDPESADPSEQPDELIELTSGTDFGYAWTAVLDDSGDQPCVGFAEDGEIVGGTVCDEGTFPEQSPVLQYIGTAAPGVDRQGILFLATDDASELVVTFSDGATERRPFERVEAQPTLTAAALVGPECGTLSSVAVTSDAGSELYSIDRLDEFPTCGQGELLTDG